MDIHEALEGRKSIRAFKADSVPRDVVEKVLRAAIQAPSSSNQQPWRFIVVAGEEREKLAQGLVSAYRAKAITYDPSKGKTIPQYYVDKTRQLFREIHSFIQEAGFQTKNFVEEGSYQFYHAPVAILAAMERCFPRSRLMDIGFAVQNLMLSAHALGLGTCPLALILTCEDVIRKELDIPESQEVVLGIALGYPDTDSPINRFKSSRDDLNEMVTWKGC